MCATGIEPVTPTRGYPTISMAYASWRMRKWGWKRADSRPGCVTLAGYQNASSRSSSWHAFLCMFIPFLLPEGFAHQGLVNCCSARQRRYWLAFFGSGFSWPCNKTETSRRFRPARRASQPDSSAHARRYGAEQNRRACEDSAEPRIFVCRIPERPRSSIRTNPTLPRDSQKSL